MNGKLALVVMSVFLVATVAEARVKNGIEASHRREVRQQKRIANAVKNGQISEKEEFKLKLRKTRIDRKQASVTADGKVTKKEKRQLAKMQKRQAASIAMKKHYGQKRIAKAKVPK